MLKRTLLIELVLLLLLAGCEQWNETEEVSHVSYLPKFEITGGEFISMRQSDTAEYTDPGVLAYSADVELGVYSIGTVDLKERGVYIIRYYAQNADGLWNFAERIISVTNYDVTSNNLSGTYTGTNWEPLQESLVRRIDSAGYYECSEIFGFPGAEMPGRFVDIGNNELVLLHGEGYFGGYETVYGAYSLSTLSWTVSLTDAPYVGVDVPVIWKKKN